MNYKRILHLIKNLVTQPRTETIRLVGETENIGLLFKKLIIPTALAVIVAQFAGNVVFGHYYFSQIPEFLLKVCAPVFMTLALSSILYPILLNEILQYFALHNKLSRSFYIITYAFIPVLAMEFTIGLLPKLRPMLSLFNIYSYYILWLMLKAEYPDISNHTHRNVALTAIISMALLHWAIVACTKFLL